MNRRALERTLETLSRRELRALAADLSAMVGADAVARLSDASPFAPAASQPQLLLAAIDVEQAAARLGSVQSCALAAIRASAPSESANAPGAGLARALATDALSEAIDAGLRTALDDANAALRFDLRTGLDFALELLETGQRLERAADRLASRWRAPALALEPLFDTLRDRARVTPVDELTFGRLLNVCVLGEALDYEGAWQPLDAALEGGKNPSALRWIAQILEQNIEPSHTLPLLRILSAHTTEPTIDRFVQAAELHLALGAAVFELLSSTLARHARLSEARFWLGEGRLRFPDECGWASLEASMSVV